MVFWEQSVELLRACIFACSQACGGNLATGIVAVTFLVRMAMLPLTLRLARQSAARQKVLRKLKPDLGCRFVAVADFAAGTPRREELFLICVNVDSLPT